MYKCGVCNDSEERVKAILSSDGDNWCPYSYKVRCATKDSLLFKKKEHSVRVRWRILYTAFIATRQLQTGEANSVPISPDSQQNSVRVNQRVLWTHC